MDADPSQGPFYKPAAGEDDAAVPHTATHKGHAQTPHHQLPATQEEYLTLAQAADRLGLGIKTLRRAVQAGTLPRRYAPSRYGAQLLLTADEVRRWQAERHAKSLVRVRSEATNPQAWTRLETRLAEHMTELERVREQSAATMRRLQDLQERHDELRAIVDELISPKLEPQPSVGPFRKLAQFLGLSEAEPT